VEKECAR